MRSRLGLLVCTLLAAPAAAVALQQAPGAGACAAHDREDGCVRVAALRGDADVALSPDGRFVHVAVAGRGQGAIITFRRSSAGRLKPAAIVRRRSLRGVANIEVTPDGRHAYGSGLVAFRRDRRSGRLTRIAAPQSSAVADLVVAPDGRHLYVSRPLEVFARDARTGRLRRVSCGACKAARGLQQPSELAISPDGTSLYVAAQGDTVVTLGRDPRSGRLSALPGDRGCVSAAPERDGCRPARAIRGLGGLAVTPDGTDVYASASRFNRSGELFVLSSGIALLRRDPADGALTQPDGAAGCFAYAGDEEHGCTRTGGQLFAPRALAATRDGRTLLAAHPQLDAIRLLRRDPATGALTEDACLSQLGRFSCVRARGLGGVDSLAVSSDVRGLVTAGHGGAVASLVFDPTG